MGYPPFDDHEFASDFLDFQRFSMDFHGYLHQWRILGRRGAGGEGVEGGCMAEMPVGQATIRAVAEETTLQMDTTPCQRECRRKQRVRPYPLETLLRQLSRHGVSAPQALMRPMSIHCVSAPTPMKRFCEHCRDTSCPPLAP